MWRATVLTIFPEMFPGPLGVSLAGKALASGLWSLDSVDIRAHAIDKHNSVDDTPAGGGAGMVMKADVMARALDALPSDKRPRLLMSPRGAPLTQARVEQLAKGDGVIVVCGRYEGIDERVITARGLEEVSLGDYVLSGGEIAACVLIDARGGCYPAWSARRRLLPRRVSPTVCWSIRNSPGPRLRGPGHSRGAYGRRSRQGRGLAAGGGRAPYARAAA
jgi:tRNA G37 N-methylase TrmD